MGLCSTTGRLANIGIPFLIAFLYTQGGITAVLGLISAGLFVQGVVVFVLGVETKGMALEAVSTEPRDSILTSPVRQSA